MQLVANAPAALFINGIFVESANALAVTYMVVQLATGAGGSEVSVSELLVHLTTGSTVALGYRPIDPPIPVANGVRIACKTADSVGGKATLITLQCINQANVVDDGIAVGTVTTLTNLPAITANWLTSAGINANALNGKGDWLLSSSYTAPPTVAAIATGVWTDTTAGDFTTALSIGKSVMNGVSLGSALHIALVDTLTTYTGNTVQTGDSFARIGNLGAGLTNLAQAATAVSNADYTAARAVKLDHLNADITSRLAPTVQGNTLDVSGTGGAGIDWANIKSAASSINLSATTIANLTNAPTVGDLTATMKASVATAVWTQAMAELAAVPEPTAQIIDGLTFMFMGMRNRRETTATSDKVENNAGGVIGTAVLSDDGTTFTKGKFA